MMNDSQLLPNWLAHRAAVLPGRLALLADDARWTFAELDRRASAMARGLLARGLIAGDRVALLLRNHPQFVALAHAAPRAGVTLVLLNTRLAAPELGWQIADSGARLLIYDADTAALAAAALAQVSDSQVTGAEACAATRSHNPADAANDSPQPDGRQHEALSAMNIAELPTAVESSAILRETIDLAEIYTLIYTSGTTGQPKGALLTYGNYWWSAVGSALNLGSHIDDRWLAVLPLFHVGGLSILVRAAVYGIPAVLHSSFDPLAVNRAIDEEGVTIISVVSTMLQRMLDARGNRRYPAALRCVLLGGGPAPQPLLESCAARGVPVVQTYGLTETASQVATLAPADALRKLGSAGQPLLPTELRIMSAGVGQVGEILVRGPTVMRGYSNRPEQTALALRDGWLHTGDLGYLDAEGYLYVVSRRNDLVISGGENIYPAEVESVLLAHPAVEEAALLGLPDARWGQVPVAAVKLREGMAVTVADLIDFCRARLASYKVPKLVRFAAALPRNAAGKLLRDEIRAAFDGPMTR
jgi:O-succinylbenzoic acid--CoA ligase